jgi:hypothetical protein
MTMKSWLVVQASSEKQSYSPSDAMTRKTQIQKFKDAARSLPTDDSEKRFNERLGKIAKHKPKPGSQKGATKARDVEGKR